MTMTHPTTNGTGAPAPTTQDEETAATVDFATFELEADDLRRVLVNSILFTSKDQVRPILRSVRFTTVSQDVDDYRLQVEATDSYGLLSSILELPNPDGEKVCTRDTVRPFSAMIDRDDAAELAKSLKAAGDRTFGDATVRVTVGPETFAVEFSGRSATYRTVPGDWPNTAQLWETADRELSGAGRHGPTSIGIVPAQLARLAKLEHAEKGKAPATVGHDPFGLRFELVNELRPIVVTIDPMTRALIIPYRLP